MSKSLLFLLMLTFFTATSQEYLPLAVEGSHWFYDEYEPFSDFPAITGGHLISIGGDTMLDNRIYKKVYLHEMAGSHDCQFPPCWTFDRPYKILATSLVSLIFEDIPNRKVYNLPLDSTGLDFCRSREYLLFDFSISQGDTLNDCALEIINWEESGPVDYDIDTVFISDPNFDSQIDGFFDVPRRVHSIMGYDYFVGLLFESDVFIAEGFGFTRLGIFGQKGATLVDYCRGDLLACEIVNSDFSYQQESLSIVPNPVASTMTVEGLVDFDYIEIRDIRGRMVEKVTSTINFDLSNLPSGLYFAVIKARSSVIIKKIIKN